MTYNVMERMIEYFGKDVKRINHSLKVHAFASLIASNEKPDRTAMDIINYSALLHDIGIKESEKKYGSSSGSHQEVEGPPIAREILTNLKINDSIIERVCFIIAHHHTYKAIDGIDFQILVEADFLVNIFEDGLEENSVTGVRSKIFKTPAGIALLENMYL